MVGSLKMNTTLEYSTRVVQEGDRRCKKSTLNDLAYLTPLRIPVMNPVSVSKPILAQTRGEFLLCFDLVSVKIYTSLPSLPNFGLFGSLIPPY
jgi:hypothetical protein